MIFIKINVATFNGIQLLPEMFKKIGMGPGVDLDAMDEGTKKGLIFAAADGV